MVFVGFIVKALWALGMIGVVVIVFEAFIELWWPSQKQQTNITITFKKSDPKD